MGVKNAFLGRLLASSDKFSDEQVAQTINLLIEHGVKHHASDIHIEPHERFGQVRYRIDNSLRGMHKLPLAALPSVSAQIKELANMRVNEEHIPQEGQYATLVGEEQFEIQVHIMPVIGGEKIVMHISRRLTEPPTLESLGFWGQNLQLIRSAISRSHGLIIVATPRRNGKTTTLHSMLQTLNIPAVSIATVENTIEYRLPGVSQTLVRPSRGVSTYDGLIAVLNQDPNVILLSDVADKPTANVAVQAAAGGHLVLMGMHADSAVDAVTRMQALTEEPFLFANALRTAISQRLVRKLCAKCREAYQPHREEIVEIEKTFGVRSAEARQRVHELERQAASTGLGGSALHTSPDGIMTIWRANDNGCEACHHTGYQGLIAITEVLEADSYPLQASLLNPLLPERLLRIALKEGFIPMGLDGLVKAIRGQTTITELLRTLSL